jgi:hypothetical protein
VGTPQEKKFFKKKVVLRELKCGSKQICDLFKKKISCQKIPLSFQDEVEKAAIRFLSNQQHYEIK